MDATKVLLTAIPGLSGLARFIVDRRERMSWKHVERLATLSERLEGEARASVLGLIANETELLVQRDADRMDRELDTASVAAIIFIVTVATAVTWGMWIVGTWWSYTILGLIDLLSVLLVGVGSTQLWVKRSSEPQTASAA